ncbi:MAG TPA: Asp-tRNA(Asn)/Glu-tRNA(Gln) amidotransferase subunit GatC [Chlamydiales bacterium]|jgi:aspartyl-tRNA(Asn)/glutamyl-tRNA(Gln) amidotransferase subunit C
MFDRQDLEHLKKLCRLECSPQEEEKLLVSLQNVLSYIEELKEVNTDNVAPCNDVLRSISKQALREDVPGHLFPREQFLSNAPDQIGGMVRVPPVLKGS